MYTIRQLVAANTERFNFLFECNKLLLALVYNYGVTIINL